MLKTTVEKECMQYHSEPEVSDTCHLFTIKECEESPLASGNHNPDLCNREVTSVNTMSLRRV